MFNKLVRVFLSATTMNGGDPGTFSIQSVNSEAFLARFVEWNYRDETHAKEKLEFLALERGTYTMADGTVIEVGIYYQDGLGVFEYEGFNHTFSATPHVFLMPQSARDIDTYTVRAKDITTKGFTSAIFKQELNMSGDHPSELIAYIAILPGNGLSGTFDSTNGPVSYTLYSANLSSGASPIGGELYSLQEEKSRDTETSHTKETVQMLDIGGVSIVQQVTSNGADTTSIRRH